MGKWQQRDASPLCRLSQHSIQNSVVAKLSGPSRVDFRFLRCVLSTLITLHSAACSRALFQLAEKGPRMDGDELKHEDENACGYYIRRSYQYRDLDTAAKEFGVFLSRREHTLPPCRLVILESRFGRMLLGPRSRYLSSDETASRPL
jgi:hypothetical protein